ncbi:MAG TPA: phosphoribosylformylglycinamidine synthase subunit PurL, partial [Candidatus Omnitrophota bacterium]|nr:phosphoribosylformylglycinamidine synthase subunit PurL [Candidatus Omnitrophota bacterium]
RDSLGTGLGAKPICNTDVFCFAPPDMSFKELPSGTLHPKRVMKGVVAGVRDYGNKMGIPTVNGAILFDKKFVGNPLVFCGNVGLIPKDKVVKSVQENDLIVVAGGRTGRDGIHGATFSSGELTEESEVISSGAVQIGNPIAEKKVMDVLLQARDQNLYNAITDCGAGGLSSAVGEMAQDLGCRVDLEKVPLKYQGLKYAEIWISESQERMVLAVPPSKIAAFLKIFSDENVEAAVIGEFTGSKQCELFFEGSQVADLSMEFLHRGIPKVTKEAVFALPKLKNPKFPCPMDLTKKLFEVLSHDNVASKEWVVRQYDHEVQGTSVLKPFVGVNTDGPSDAAVLRPRLNTNKGIAVSNGINVRFGMIDPFWMAASVIDEAIRQIIAVGGNLGQIAILDNFCWGNPDKPDRLGSLVRAAEGCYKTAIGFQVPFISGKDSLYNEYMEKGKSLAIPGTLLISAVGIIEDVTKVVSMDFKKAGNLIYVVGETFDELGGSIYLDTFGLLGENVPKVNSGGGARIFQRVSNSIEKGLVRSAHDCSEGGLGAALAEMAFAGGLGATVRLDQVPFKNLNGTKERNDTILFSESNSRFVVEVERDKKEYFEQCLKGVSFAQIGRVEESPEFVVYGLDQKVCVKTFIDVLKQAWQKSLS